MGSVRARSQHPRSLWKRLYRQDPQDLPGRSASAGLEQQRAQDRDSLVGAIDDYLKELSDIDALFVPTSSGRRCSEPGRVSGQYEQVARIQRRLLRLLDAMEIAAARS